MNYNYDNDPKRFEAMDSAMKMGKIIEERQHNEYKDEK